jgi:CRP-like cAMP-binding protein
MIGREGAAGLQSARGPRCSFARAIVQIPGESYTVSAELLRAAIDISEEAKDFVNRYMEIRWAEAQQLAACNAIHVALPRLARWLLQSADRIGGMQVRLTQKFLGEMLGIRWTSVTLLAQGPAGADSRLSLSRTPGIVDTRISRPKAASLFPKSRRCAAGTTRSNS